MSATPRPWTLGRKHDYLAKVMVTAAEAYIADCEQNDIAEDQANAALIVEAVNAYDAVKAENARLREALETIAQGKGAFDLDPLIHCGNCLEEAKATAHAALRGEEVPE